MDAAKEDCRLGKLFDKIKQCVLEERYLIGDHASERLDDRGVLEWQVVQGVESARLLRKRPRSKPNPSVEAMQVLADGTDVKVVWSHIKSIDMAKLVTVHFLDE